MKQDAFSQSSFNVVVPELDAGGGPITFVNWLVPVNAKVILGERLAEILTQGVIFYLEATDEGTLSEQLASPGDNLRTGSLLGRISAPQRIQ